ncbi:DUF4276 family protein [Candidatus Thiodictyon syntrophicum]|jgi:hypothetical protein|uniref:DUF4276 domain-containing protein n=1 Tax=Candidatus Thiodictyon syntrophicum TaxID=1166950 RepID=A0A2K8U5P6_9GAMM|nr:DUF4276 family protein [Candidatus Thiodictyon syntrophicum]AUB80875.1 hypothetical protein THSYN_07875 [Candidatus Thiodictyon syntrophicum]
MHYLSLALYAEGPTDYSFLCPVLERLCEAICLGDAPQPVEISECLSLNHPESANDAPREQRIFEAAQGGRGHWGVLFIHADGAGDPVRVRNQQAQPAIDRLRQAFANEGVGVAVVPVRETEAWAIVDGEALRQVFGTTLTDDEMGLPPSPGSAEAAADPKATLAAAFKATHPSGLRKRRGVSPMLNALGEQVSLQRLRQLDAFAALDSELRLALRQLRILE